uniref:Uncharacterized protein n=1 Tax=Pygoscelis antarcticus TaxID=79643 RepID=A0A7G7LKK0_PYGAN|nr:hypothetical protein [Pygoscelis antarcticus]
MDFLPVLTSIENEMLRRYNYMAENAMSELQISETSPQIVLVIDELPAFMMNVGSTKERASRTIELLKSIVNQCRQCGITVVLSGQTVGSDVIPTAVRSSFAQRFLLKIQGMEQLKIACDGRMEEAGLVSIFYLPGQVAACSSYTRNEYVYGRVLLADVEQRQRNIGAVSADKHDLACLNWEDENYLG